MFHHLHRAGQAAAVAAALALVSPQLAQAAPTFAASPASVHQNGDLTKVRYYGHWHGRYWHGGYWHGGYGAGPAIAGAALGLFGLAANAAVADSYYDGYDYPYYGPVYPYYGNYGYPYGFGGYGGWHHGWYRGWRGPVGIHNHR
jgi:hypothetical protein